MKEIYLTAGIGIVSSVVTAFVTWFFTRKKQQAEAEEIKAQVQFKELENVDKAISVYRKLAEDLEERIKEYKELLDQQEKEIQQLKKEISQLRQSK